MVIITAPRQPYIWVYVAAFLRNAATNKKGMANREIENVEEASCLFAGNRYGYHEDESNFCDGMFKVQTPISRTRGTSKLRSQVLITTLIDEVVFGWQEVTKLYLQRYCVELAFRHLKIKIGIERIRKRKLLRIEQLLFAAIVLFNLSVALRNRIRRSSLLLEKAGIKPHCFTLCIELLHIFLQATLKPQYGVKKKMDVSLRAIRGCWFIYKSWRAEPRICHTPPSEFSVQKGVVMLAEVESAKFLSIEYEILAQKYGQKEQKNA